MLAKIYRPSKNAMQSGKAKSDVWILEMETAPKRSVDPLMGWTGSDTTDTQVRISFDSMEDAVAYAKREEMDFRVLTSKEPKRIIKTYADNFSADRKFPWTH
ncbi:ETC complex I subunit [Hirschia maritima]|uniref:ETC complex I subunit n=1 Tax=Hirschia maritima TaxID=1121961 RepID=UPI00039DFAA4|nr:ETC complex I subunit [Hirschia maritima]